MKKFLIAMTLVAALAIAASAQVPSPFSIYAGGLMSLPQSPSQFKDMYKNGWHGMAGLGWKVAPAFQAVAKAELHSFGVDFANTTWATSNPNLAGGTNRIALFGLDGRFSPSVPSLPFKPFVLAGGGMAHISQTEYSGDPLATSLNTSFPSAQNKMFWNIGAGIELKGSPFFGFFAQVRYVSVKTDNESSAFVPITLGLKFF